MHAFSSSGVRKVDAHMPSEGKITSPQTPSWSRSPSRSRASLMPSALRLSSMNFTAAEVGSLRRNVCPSTRTVSYSPSGSFSAFGVRVGQPLGQP